MSSKQSIPNSPVRWMETTPINSIPQHCGHENSRADDKNNASRSDGGNNEETPIATANGGAGSKNSSSDATATDATKHDGPVVTKYQSQMLAMKSQTERKMTMKSIPGSDCVSASGTHVPCDPNVITTKQRPHLQRSKTETSLLPAKSGTYTCRNPIRNLQVNGSSRCPRSKSSQHVLPEPSKSPQKSYNTQEVRRYMDEQKIKRQSLQTNPLQMSAKAAGVIDRELIKKRLEDLRKNTRTIVRKNVLKAAKKKLPVSSTQPAHEKEQLGTVTPHKNLKIEKTFPEQRTGRLLFKQKANSEEQQENNSQKDNIRPSKTEIIPKDSIFSIPQSQSAIFDNPNSDPTASCKALKPQQTITQKQQSSSKVVTSRTSALGSSSSSSIEVIRSDVYNRKQQRTRPNPSPLKENFKKIGLLRKPETKDHSFSAIKDFNIDKENVVIEMLTPKLNIPIESRLKEKEAITAPAPSSLSLSSASVCAVRDGTSQTNLQLNVPKAKLEVPLSLRDKSVQVQEKLPFHQNKPREPPTPSCTSTGEVPYWLKPSAVQVYPYNFIMAVRKKLEAIAKPTLISPAENETITSLHKRQEQVKNKKLEETPVSSHSVAASNLNVKRRIIHNEEYELEIEAHHDKTSDVAKAGIVQQSYGNASAQVSSTEGSLHLSKSFSEITSNFSSISLQIPESNTISEISSIQSKSNRVKATSFPGIKTKQESVAKTSDDDTTISSSIFSSPEKKSRRVVSPTTAISRDVTRPLSPLSVDNISNLHITGKSKYKSDQTRNVNFNRGDQLTVPTLSLVPSNACDSDDPLNSHRSSESNVNFSELLDNFNRSLSQVIEVNHQLKSTLHKSHQIFSPDRIKNSMPPIHRKYCTAKSSDDYSANFEEETAGSSTSTSKAVTSSPAKAVTSLPAKEISPAKKDPNIATKLVNNMSTALRNKKSLFSLEDGVKPLCLSSDESQTTRSVNDTELSLVNLTGNSFQSKTVYNAHSFEQRLLSNDGAKQEVEKGSHSEMEIDTKFSSSSEIITRTASSSSSSSDCSTNCINSKMQTEQKLPPEMNKKDDCQSISEQLIAESEKPIQKNLSGNQFSEDSLGIAADVVASVDITQYTRCEFLKNHINTLRGEFLTDKGGDDFKDDTYSPGPPGYNIEQENKANRNEINDKVLDATTTSNSVIGSELVTALNQSELELSITSHNGSLSESTLNYSSVGMYEKLILNETTKSDHLTALLRLREKTLLDRTRGQIAWLQVQKERYKAKGLTVQISTIKKKQRGIILKMEKEREEIKRLLQSTAGETVPEHLSGRAHRERRVLPPPVTFFALNAEPPTTNCKSRQYFSDHCQQKNKKLSARPATTGSPPRSSSAIVRGYELESSHSLEKLLQKREEDLRKRRKHVERLMEWHQRLDQEEAEVLQLERLLIDYNVNVQQHQQPTTSKKTNVAKQKKLSISTSTTASSTQHIEKQQRKEKMERKLKEIDKSLRELNSICSVTGSGGGASDSDDITADNNTIDFVRTTGSKLNKLWRRLTSQHVEKFEPHRRYKLCKDDLECLYEEAKTAVLTDFGHGDDRLGEFLNKSSFCSSQPSSFVGSITHAAADDIPRLDLNFSSGQSDIDQEVDTVAAQGNYSPSAAEEEFVEVSKAGATTSSTSAASSDVHEESDWRSHAYALPPTAIATSNATSLRRSLSDTQLSTKKPRVLERSSCYINSSSKSQRTICNNSKTEKSSCTEEKLNSARTSLNTASSINSSLYDTSNGIASKPNTLESVQSLQLCLPNNYEAASRKTVETSYQRLSKNVDDSVKKSLAFVENASKKSHIPTDTISTEEMYQIESMTSNDSGRSATSASITDNISLDSAFIEKSRPHIGEMEKISSSTTELDSTPTSGEILPTAKRNMNLKSAEQTGFFVSGSVRNSKCSGTSSGPKYNSELAKMSTNDKLSEKQSYSNSAGLDLNSFPIEALDTVAVNGGLSINCTPNEIQDELLLTNLNENGEHLSLSLTNTISTVIDKTTDSSINEISYSENIDVSIAESELQLPLHDLKSSPPSYTNSDEDQTKNLSFQSIVENIVSNDSYKDDFEPDDENEKEETNLDNLTMPQLETTAEEEEKELTNNETFIYSEETSSYLKTRLIELDVSLRDLHTTFVKALSPEKIPSSSFNDNTIPVECTTTVAVPSTSNVTASTAATVITTTTTTTTTTAQTQLMPDIINEVELRRCQHFMLENEQMKQFENVTAVPYMYVREIPNKPPPPYVPPAHGSPMTTIFPSEERIKDITFRRTQELYCEMLKTDLLDEIGQKIPSVMDEKITNIFERIILDICREYLSERSEILTKSDPTNFHSLLAFFNPPNRLRCIQEFVYKEVRRCLAMDKNQPKRTQVYSVYGSRAKRDHIGKIIIQEMYEEDDKWCNFHLEQTEVLDLITDEMIVNAIRDIATDVILEQGGSVEEAKEKLEENKEDSACFSVQNAECTDKPHPEKAACSFTE